MRSRGLERAASVAAHQEHGRDEHDQPNDQDSQHASEHGAIIAQGFMMRAAWKKRSFEHG